MMENGAAASDDDEFIEAYSFKPTSEFDTCGVGNDPGFPPDPVTIVSTCAAVRQSNIGISRNSTPFFPLRSMSVEYHTHPGGVKDIYSF